VTGDLPPPDHFDWLFGSEPITPDSSYQRKVGPMLASEREHIQKFGRVEFQKRLVMANMCCRQDARFVGLDKIRSQIAFQAALQATGYEQRPLKLVGCGGITGTGADGMKAADELFARAIAAART